MINFIKRWWNKPRCQHTKGIGEPMPKNMHKILEFIENRYAEKGHIWIMSYRIYECDLCGERSFSSHPHLLGSRITSAVDAFIQHKLSEESLIIVLEQDGFTARKDLENDAE